jgi:DnaK suppressor protein
MTNTTSRNALLRDILFGWRRNLQDDVQNRIRDGRADRPHDVCDDLERSDANISEEVEFALLQLKAETLSRIDAAIARLDVGEYGRCFECAVEISETRLRALPFAVRCMTCEERREQQGQARTRRLAQQHAGSTLFQS